ncbi:MAG: efflux transporter periplasmic adaptor subunit [Parachlamydia sp.]|nr:MAG: efflux transporter periplasmic adaptor subunit [Parachlamydia sp.]
MSRKYLTIFSLGLLILGLCLASFFYPQPTPPSPKPLHSALVQPVAITVAALHPFHDGIDVIGSVFANESIQLTAKVTEIINKIHFSEGQFVQKGDVIVELNAEEEKAILEEAEKQYQRIENLAQSAAATLTKRDQHLLNVQVAQAHVNHRTLKAPFAGVLGLRKVSEGTLVTPGTIITSLDDISVVKFEFSVAERRAGMVALGQKVKATSIAFPNEPFIGTIYAIDTRVNPLTRALVVKALIPNEKLLLKPGMLMHARILLPPEDVLLIPEEAIHSKKGEKVVYVVDADGHIQKNLVTLGRRLAGSVEVLTGVTPGDQIVVESRTHPEVGEKVAIVETKTLESSIAEFHKFKS